VIAKGWTNFEVEGPHEKLQGSCRAGKRLYYANVKISILSTFKINKNG
jgi:hypothetical protein